MSTGDCTARMDVTLDTGIDIFEPHGPYLDSSVWDEPSVALEHQGVVAFTSHTSNYSVDGPNKLLEREHRYHTEPIASNGGVALSIHDINIISEEERSDSPSMRRSVDGITGDVLARVPNDVTESASSASRNKLKAR